MKAALKEICRSLKGRVILSIILVLVISLGVLFYFIEIQQERLLLKQVESQARVLFKQILLTRRWIADHGGIFVEKLPWVKENPYLEDSVIIDITGKRYVKENPAYVTRQLSEYSKKEGLYWFHITSLNLVNPANRPDAFEKEALMAFETKGVKEISKIVQDGRQRYLRYIAPLYVEPSCLGCHKGYRIGDVRGAISVTMPVNHIFRELNRYRLTLIVGGLVTVVLLMGALYVALNRAVLRPVERLRMEMAGIQKGQRVEINPPETRELADLYRSFQQLMETITHYQEHLEEEVQKATASLREANEKLIETTDRYRKLSEKKSELITYLSHELRTPLTAIKGSIDYILARLEQLQERCSRRCDLSEIHSFAHLACSNIDRLSRLVNAALDLEKIELGLMEFNFKRFDLAKRLREMCLEILPLLAEKHLRLKTEIEDHLYVYADEDRITQVAQNLLQNAIDFTPDDGTITVDAYKSGEWVIFRIIDTGPGIPHETQKKVFEKFYKGKKKGTGLGLAISRAIVEAHNGQIGVISDGEKGSTFYVKLLRADEAPDTYS